MRVSEQKWSSHLLERPWRKGSLPNELRGARSRTRCARSLGGSRSAIWRRMLDQRRLAGIGTILASEICFRAEVHPLAPANSLNEQQWEQIHQGLKDHVAMVLKENVGPEIDYLRPGMKTFFLCYGKKNTPCQRCESLIVKETVATRPVFWCPSCQRL